MNQNPLVTKLMKYGATALGGLALAYAFTVLRVESLAQLFALEPVEIYRILCDAFTIPGLLMLMFGIMMSISNTGALDGVAYVVGNGFKMLIPGKAGKMEKYYEYIQRKKENRVKGYGFLYIVGAVFMAIALIFMALFYSVY